MIGAGSSTFDLAGAKIIGAGSSTFGLAGAKIIDARLSTFGLAGAKITKDICNFLFSVITFDTLHVELLIIILNFILILSISKYIYNFMVRNSKFEIGITIFTYLNSLSFIFISILVKMLYLKLKLVILILPIIIICFLTFIHVFILKHLIKFLNANLKEANTILPIFESLKLHPRDFILISKSLDQTYKSNFLEQKYSLLGFTSFKNTQIYYFKNFPKSKLSNPYLYKKKDVLNILKILKGLYGNKPNNISNFKKFITFLNSKGYTNSECLVIFQSALSVSYNGKITPKTHLKNFILNDLSLDNERHNKNKFIIFLKIVETYAFKFYNKKAIVIILIALFIVFFANKSLYYDIFNSFISGVLNDLDSFNDFNYFVAFLGIFFLQSISIASFIIIMPEPYLKSCVLILKLRILFFFSVYDKKTNDNNIKLKILDKFGAYFSKFQDLSKTAPFLILLSTESVKPHLFDDYVFHFNIKIEHLQFGVYSPPLKLK